MKCAISFTNLGPYHLARLRALAAALGPAGGGAIAIETAGGERKYPWSRREGDEPFRRVTLFPDRALEALEKRACREAMIATLERERPDVVAVAGYVRPECLAALGWARRRRKAALLLCESQEIDHPRIWWKEAIKGRRVRRFGGAVAGGPPHRDYLVKLGMPAGRIALGYDVVDNDAFADRAAEVRRDAGSRSGLPDRPYFLSVCRFVPEKNLGRLVRAYAAYRALAPGGEPWDLVLVGDGPGSAELDATIAAAGVGARVHRPGFLQEDGVIRWMAHAGALVLPSISEPWGLVGNEGAACGLPLLISRRAGCASTLVREGVTGLTFDPFDEGEIADALARMASQPESGRAGMGRAASELVREWGPGRFAAGVIEAARHAGAPRIGAAPVAAGDRR
jgi:1,2-diacylglycerol 3-alpha-glucosyltransferase